MGYAMDGRLYWLVCYIFCPYIIISHCYAFCILYRPEIGLPPVGRSLRLLN